MELQLVADTNLFFECKVLEELPWQELGHDPIVILLTKPVLDEIDKHKKMNGRTRSRALDIFRRVRALLLSSKRETEIRTADPKVILRLITNVKPDPTRSEELDYTKTDERLIGIVSTLNAKASSPKVSLFTDDTGPASTADGLPVPYLLINESWRRPRSKSAEEKNIEDLQKELAAYKDQEPQIVIGRCENADEMGRVEVLRKVATPLAEVEIDDILAKLSLKHPSVTDFVPPPPSSSTGLAGEVTRVEYSPPPEDEIATYRDVSYPQWLDTCRSVLRNLHQGHREPEPPVTLRWPMWNNGTRPASNVRIDFEAKGQLELIRTVDRDEAEGDNKLASSSASQPSPVPPAHFPSPPKQPVFRESVIRTPAPEKPKIPQGGDISTLRATGALGGPYRSIARIPSGLDLAGFDSRSQQMKGATAAAEAFGSIGRNMQVIGVAGLSSMFDQLPLSDVPVRAIKNDIVPQLIIPDPHDSEGFYYVGWPANRPVKKGGLTCDRWRHHMDEEVFEFDVLFTSEGDARGVVECTVHAENLTKPEQAKIVVRRSIEQVSMLEMATEILEACDQ